jgi:thioredoxin 1
VSDKIVHTNDSRFDADVLQSDKAVLLDFWAEWCGPCKMIAPLLDEAAEQYADRLTVAKINIDENPNAPAKFGIRSIPTLMLFKNGTVQDQKLGAMSKSQLTEFLEKHLCGDTWVIKPEAGRNRRLSKKIQTARVAIAAAGAAILSKSTRTTVTISRSFLPISWS